MKSYWIVCILAKDANERDNIRQHLKAHDIEKRPLFYPAHTMTTFKTKDSCPVAESLSSRGLDMSSFTDLTKEQVSFVSSKIIEAIKK
jgi:perosamine synthetase